MALNNPTSLKRRNRKGAAPGLIKSISWVWCGASEIFFPLSDPLTKLLFFLHHLIRAIAAFLVFCPHHNNPHIIEPLAADLWLYGQAGHLIGQLRGWERGRQHSRSFVRWNKSRVQLKISWESLLPSLPEGLWRCAKSVASCAKRQHVLFSRVLLRSLIWAAWFARRLWQTWLFSSLANCENESLNLTCAPFWAGRTTLDGLRWVRGRSGQRWNVMRSQPVLWEPLPWELQEPRGGLTSCLLVSLSQKDERDRNFFFSPFLLCLLTGLGSTNQLHTPVCISVTEMCASLVVFRRPSVYCLWGSGLPHEVRPAALFTCLA